MTTLNEEVLSKTAVNRSGRAEASQESLTAGARMTRSAAVLRALRGGALGGIRTPNLLIRSQMLYPLSYERQLERTEVWDRPARGVSLAARPPHQETAAAARLRSPLAREIAPCRPVALAGRLGVGTPTSPQHAAVTHPYQNHFPAR